MKDAYSFDLDAAGARHSYNKMFIAYLRTFARLGLTAIPMVADTGPIGGDLSHEFIILADTGESEVFCHKDYLQFAPPPEAIDFDSASAMQGVFDKWTSLYAATSEKHDAGAFEALNAGGRAISARGIEVGHIFYFGTKYSAADEGGRQRPRREGASRAHGFLRHRPEPPRGGADRGEPRRSRDHLAGGGRAVLASASSISRSATRPATAPAGASTPTSARRASSRSTTTATSAPARNSPRWTSSACPIRSSSDPKSLADGKVEIKNRRSGERELVSVDAAIARLSGKA